MPKNHLKNILKSDFDVLFGNGYIWNYKLQDLRGILSVREIIIPHYHPNNSNCFSAILWFNEGRTLFLSYVNVFQDVDRLRWKNGM